MKKQITLEEEKEIIKEINRDCINSLIGYNYGKQLKQPQWGYKRDIILSRDKHKCTECGSKKELHVHHKVYYNKTLAWEYVNEDLITLCKSCHRKLHDSVKIERKEFIDNPYFEKEHRELMKIKESEELMEKELLNNINWIETDPYKGDVTVLVNDFKIFSTYKSPIKVLTEIINKKYESSTNAHSDIIEFYEKNGTLDIRVIGIQGDKYKLVDEYLDKGYPLINKSLKKSKSKSKS